MPDLYVRREQKQIQIFLLASYVWGEVCIQGEESCAQWKIYYWLVLYMYEYVRFFLTGG